MQYEITLPADYDMAIIRERVATRGSRTDAFPGLGLKAYAVREKGKEGSPVNQYAPFYLWASGTGMNDFLFGPAFDGIVTDFGRPAVRHWTGLGIAFGPAAAHPPGAATRSTTRLGPDLPLQKAIGSAVREMREQADTPGVHSTTAVVDPASWELVRFTLWARTAPDGFGDRYQVLHTSTPHLSDLPRDGRW